MWHGENLGYSSESFSERLNVLQLFIFFLLGIISCRIISFQVVKGGQYRKISDENRIVIYSQPATRGKVFDKNMDIIVDNKSSFVVLFSRQMLADDEVKNVISRIAKLLSIPDDRILSKIKTVRGKNLSLVKIAENILLNQATN